LFHIQYDSMKRKDAPTFETLYEVVQHTGEEKKTILKVDRNVLQRLVTSYAAGCNVDLSNILKHELMPVSAALAETN